MNGRQIIIEVTPETMNPADLKLLNSAIENIASLARSGVLVMRSKRMHADRGVRKGDGLQPQTQSVLDFLRQHYADTVFTVGQVASQIGLSELSTRAQFHTLLAKNLVTRQANHARGRSPQGVTGWSLT